MRRLALLALPLLAACAAPAPDGRTSEGPSRPGSGFALGATGVPEVTLTPETSPSILGVWEGPFFPIDMSTGRVSSQPAGTARLIPEATEDRRITGRADWRFNDGATDETRWTAALTRTGHLRIMNSRAYIHETGQGRYLDLDLLLADGGFHRHRLVFQGD